MGDSVSATYDSSPARLYQAVLRTVAAVGYSIQHTDAGTLTVSFNTGMSLRSWAGQDMTVLVFADSESRSTVSIGGTRAQRGSIMGGGGQIADWGELAKIQKKFLERLSQVFLTVPEPVPTKAEPVDGPSLTHDLERLALLRRDGLLSDTEFEAAKKRLLDPS
jgi:hypothetical protein